MKAEWTRTEVLYGAEAIKKLQGSHVAVFGLGGVGSFAAEALLRAGIHLDVFDDDVYDRTNMNRQLYANLDTLGKPKVDVFAAYAVKINEDAQIAACFLRVGGDTVDRIPFEKYDYIVDAIDDVPAKLLLIQKAQDAGVRIISAMGAGNKRHPEMLRISTIYKTKYCPLAKVMRTESRRRMLKDYSVVYSEEISGGISANSSREPRIIGSNSFLPAAMGLFLASKVVNDIVNEEKINV